MVRGLYNIHDVEASKKAKKADTSYKSCLLTMFIAFLICVIIFLLLWRARTPSRNDPADETKHEQYAQKSVGTPPPYEVFNTSRKPTTNQHLSGKYRITNEQTTTSSQQTSPTAMTGTTPVTTTDNEEYDINNEIEFNSQENNTGGNQNANDKIVLSTTTSTSTSATTRLGGQKTSVTPDSSQQSSTSDKLIGGVNTLFNDTSVSSTISSTTPTINGLQTTSIVHSSHSSTNHKLLTTSTATTSSTTDNSFSDLYSTTDQSVSDTVTHVSGLVQTLPITSSTQHSTTESTTFNSGIHGAYFTTATTLNDSSTTMLSIVSSTDSSTSSSTSATTNSINILYSGSHNTTIAATTVATTETTTSSDDETQNMSSSSTQFPTTTNDTGDQLVCETNDCKVLTSRILSLMNHSIDPCDNFYEFACGGLRNNPTLLQDYPEQDVWRRISDAVGKIDNGSYTAYQKFLHFYEQCVDYENNLNRSERLVQAGKVVRDIGLMYDKDQWQIEKSNFNLTDMLVKLFKINSAPLFDVLLDVDTHNPSKFQLKLTVPPVHTKLQLESPIAARCKATIIPDDPHNIDMEDIYNRKYRFCTRHFEEYINDLETAVNELELFEHTNNFSISQTIGYVKLFVETDVFSVFENVAGWELRSNILEKKFKLMTVGELNHYYEAVKWDELFKSLLNTDSIETDTTVQVYFHQEYFDKLFEMLNGLKSDNDTLIMRNGLLAMLAHDLYEDLIKSQPCNREDYCLRIASGLMEDIASSLYLSTFSKDELSERQLQVETIFYQLKDILKDNVHQANWLDNVSRSAVINKIDKMTVYATGGNAYFNNTAFLNNQLPSNDLKEENSFLENSIQLLRRYRKILYNIYEGDPSEEINIWTFFILPFDTRPSAIYQLNTVVIPFGMTGSWKQSKYLPSYILKTQVGNEIARHIAHHFDTAGIKYGASGKDTDFLTEIPKDNYDASYEGCENNFNDYGRSWTNEHNQTYEYKVNAVRTMNEHITDNSALWLTHKLFNKSAEREPLLPWLNMTHSQLYFLLSAQEFCAKAELFHYTVQMHESEQLPPYLRVDNMVQNSPVFGHVYKCAVGGKHNPVVKCLPFPESEDNTYKTPLIGSF